ncbi:hypothetical protein GOP47_0017552 [Adiantum capillus-veneris]|nr:hypothetical protein GOP47_0017552 [Adiantum capillus-veneris]
MSEKEHERYAELFDEEEEEEEEGGDDVGQSISGWKETPEARVLQAELAGFDKEDITIEVKNYKVLVIKGNTTHKKQRGPVQAMFMRQITLPDDVKPKEMSASVEDGVLIIKAPKSPPKPAKRLAITN